MQGKNLHTEIIHRKIIHRKGWPFCWYTIGAGVAFFLYGVFVSTWFGIYNRYIVLHYHEQMQLFRFDGFYFRSYLGMPGGLIAYAGSFLTQFYVYPVAGSLLIAAIVMASCLFFYRICRFYGPIGRLFFVPFVPSVFLMMSFMDIYFDMSMALGSLFFLIVFERYMARPLPTRFVVGPIGIAVTYLIAGGIALLLLVMMVIFEMSGTAGPMNEKGAPVTKKKRYLYLLLLTGGSVFFVWLAWRLVYTVFIREAFFAFTPFHTASPIIPYFAFWISVPVLFFGWKLMAAKADRWHFRPWRIIVVNCLSVAVLTVGGVFFAYDRSAERLVRMNCELQQGNYKAVMALGKDFPAGNRMACYLTNIALAESGQMPYRMFQYGQTGVNGLFLEQHLSYSIFWYLGEVYYRLGMIPEAEHCAFEALVSSPKEPNVQAMRRLVNTHIVRRDSITAEKYLRFLDYSLAYRKWARRQRANLALAMADPTFHLPDTPVPCRHDDFFIDYQKPDYSLFKLLQANPTHRRAFEYLMAYYMLQKDFERVRWCMDQFFGNFDYRGIPVHYEEALVTYQNIFRPERDFYRQYPVSKATRDRFDRFAKACKVVQDGKLSLEQLKEQFGNTYWYYAYFVSPTTLQNKDEENRY